MNRPFENTFGGVDENYFPICYQRGNINIGIANIYIIIKEEGYSIDLLISRFYQHLLTHNQVTGSRPVGSTKITGF